MYFSFFLNNINKFYKCEEAENTNNIDVGDLIADLYENIKLIKEQLKNTTKEFYNLKVSNDNLKTKNEILLKSNEELQKKIESGFVTEQKNIMREEIKQQLKDIIDSQEFLKQQYNNIQQKLTHIPDNLQNFINETLAPINIDILSLKTEIKAIITKDKKGVVDTKSIEKRINNIQESIDYIRDVVSIAPEQPVAQPFAISHHQNTIVNTKQLQKPEPINISEQPIKKENKTTKSIVNNIKSSEEVEKKEVKPVIKKTTENSSVSQKITLGHKLPQSLVDKLPIKDIKKTVPIKKNSS